jgi:hypothetical protein
MSAQAVKTEQPVVITKEMMQSLKSRNRKRFTDVEVKRALAYQFANNCTLDEAAATEGMTGQTLAARRDRLAKAMGIEGDVAPSPTAKPAAVPAKKKK